MIRTIIPFAVVILMILPGTSLAEKRIIGIWQSSKGQTKLHILDGFKPNSGAVLSIGESGDTSIGRWEKKGNEVFLRVKWRSEQVIFSDSKSFRYSGSIYSKTNEIEERNVAVLKFDEEAFLDRLINSVWLTSNKGSRSTFKNTFSDDSGVVETFSKDGKLQSLEPWGVSAGVLKIGRSVIVEARATEQYIVGQDHRDNFVVFRSIRQVDTRARTELKTQRSKFLAELVRDDWQRVSFRGLVDYRFRPVEGPYKGRMATLQNGKLQSATVWEYSPSTGALKIGHSEYVGGVVVDNTLALIDKDKDQRFFRRKPGGLGKVFSATDVTVHRISESDIGNLFSVLSGQFYRGDGFGRHYLYSFEFNNDKRTGYGHRWRSVRFTVSGHRFLSDMISGKVEIIYEVEDLLFFGSAYTLQRDYSISRLRTKSDVEIIRDKKTLKKNKGDSKKSKLILRITKKDGEKQDIKLPVKDFNSIVAIQIIKQ